MTSELGRDPSEKAEMAVALSPPYTLGKLSFSGQPADTRFGSWRKNI